MEGIGDETSAWTDAFEMEKSAVLKKLIIIQMQIFLENEYTVAEIYQRWLCLQCRWL